MNPFKIGDKVLAKPGESTTILEKGRIYEVKDVDESHIRLEYSSEDSKEGWVGDFFADRFMSAIVDNPINRKLYPDFVEKDGYLKPARGGNSEV